MSGSEGDAGHLDCLGTQAVRADQGCYRPVPIVRVSQSSLAPEQRSRMWRQCSRRVRILTLSPRNMESGSIHVRSAARVLLGRRRLSSTSTKTRSPGPCAEYSLASATGATHHPRYSALRAGIGRCRRHRVAQERSKGSGWVVLNRDAKIMERPHELAGIPRREGAYVFYLPGRSHPRSVETAC